VSRINLKKEPEKPAIEGKSVSKPTWKVHSMATHGRLSSAAKNSLPASAFAFPRTRKEPMTDATHVRDAMARFDQVQDVSDSDLELAFADVQKAAKHFDIQMKEMDWRGRQVSLR
jgi:hypothetical protein